jgi:hypothetical protein
MAKKALTTLQLRSRLNAQKLVVERLRSKLYSEVQKLDALDRQYINALKAKAADRKYK